MAMYVIRIFKSWGGRVADRRWVNNYEIEAGNAAITTLDTVANAIAAAEKLIHKNFVNFLSATISTWEPDSVPYNPLSFRTIELSGVGGVTGAIADAMDSNVCLVVGFQATTGRNGRRFYRGALIEADVESGNDGRWSLSAASGSTDAGTNMNAFRTAMTPYLAAGTDPVKIVLAGANAVSVQRAVASIKTIGVTVNKRNHRYFDRA